MAKDKNDLPQLVTEAMEESIKSDQKSTLAQENLANQMKVFADSNKMFAKTSITLNKFASAQIDKINPFKKLGAAFDKTWVGQKSIQVKEEKKLAEAAGITRDELLLLKAQKEVADVQKKQAETLKKNLEEYGLNTTTFFNQQGELQARVADRDEKGRFQSAKNIVDGITKSQQLQKDVDDARQEMYAEQQTPLLSNISKGLASVKDGVLSNGRSLGESFKNALTSSSKKSEIAAIEGQRETARREEEQTHLLGQLVGGIRGMGKSLLKGIKGLGEPAGLGVGMLFGIIAAPVIALVAAFKSLKDQFAMLNRLADGKLAAPFVKAIDFIKDIGSKFSKTFSPKNVPIDKLLKPFIAMGDFFKNIGSKISGLFGKSGTFGKVFGIISKGFAPIAKFAAGFGSVLGKLFLPITIIMGIVDTVTGFMDGFETGGLLGGVMGAIKGLFNGLIMKPLDLLKDGVSWIASKLGFENFSEMLDGFSFEEMFSDMVDGLHNILTGIGEWFSSKIDFVKGLLGFETKQDKEDKAAKEREMDVVRTERSRLRANKESLDAAIDSERKAIADEYGSLADAPAEDRERIAQLNKERMAARKDLERFEDIVYRPEETSEVDEPVVATRKRVRGRGTQAGATAGADINARSSAQSSAALNVITTNAPTVVNAPTSTSMNSQTIVPASPGRSRQVGRRSARAS